MSVRVGTWITMPAPAICEIACRAGLDWICVDLEHSTLSLADAEGMIRTAQLLGVDAFVRLSNNDPVQIARIMDAGADGIIVPRVCSPEEAEAAVQACYYPPRGTRGVGLARAQAYGPGFDAYHERVRGGGLRVMVQIEHVDALPHLDAIFGIEEIVGYLVGPYDLTASMGIAGRFDHPRYHDALHRILESGQRAGVAPGIHVVEPDLEQLTARVAEGWELIAFGVDYRILDVALRDAMGSLGR